MYNRTMKVHMGPGNYGFFPLHFLSIIWPHYSIFTRQKCFHFIIHKRLSSFFDKNSASVFTFIMTWDNSIGSLS